MRWDDFRQSENVEDRRGGGGDEGGFGGGGGGFPIPGGRGSLGIGTILILGLIGWVVGIDPRQLIGMVQEIQGGGGGQFEQPFNEEEASPRRPPRQPGGEPGARPDAAADDRNIRFVHAILGNTEDVWKVVLPEQMGVQYQNPRMVVFSGATRSSCGTAQSAMGPFYCPRDKTVYLDMSFFNEMKQKFRVSGEFAYAYVLAHEVGHHVQNLLGVIPKVERGATRIGRGAEQPALRARRADGRLPGGRVGNTQQREVQVSARRRRRGGREGGGGHRRRPSAEAGAGLCGARQLHARLLCAARALR